MQEHLSTAGHTLTPWRVHLIAGVGSPIAIKDAKGYIVATVPSDNRLPVEANAAFIVRAVNNHESLLAALRGTGAAYHRQLCPDKYGESFTDCPYSRCQSNAAAIAAAEAS